MVGIAVVKMKKTKGLVGQNPRIAIPIDNSTLTIVTPPII
jgi:hypothetical protein